MSEVFALMYGCVDLEEEVVHQLYATHGLALKHARRCAEEVVSDNFADYAEITIKDTVDSDGNNVVIIATPSNEETEWWRVVTMKVWER